MISGPVTFNNLGGALQCNKDLKVVSLASCCQITLTHAHSYIYRCMVAKPVFTDLKQYTISDIDRIIQSED